jgi:hypothetical protein
MARESPDRYLINMSKSKRVGKILLDYLRNDQFSTAMAPLSPSARAHALVSMPIKGVQVKHGLEPMQYTIHTVLQLLKKSKAWVDYCDGERPLSVANARLWQDCRRSWQFDASCLRTSVCSNRSLGRQATTLSRRIDVSGFCAEEEPLSKNPAFDLIAYPNVATNL